MDTRSLKSGADVKRNEAVSLNQENALLLETPSQIQHKTKSTVVKIALLATLCLANFVVFGGVVSTSAVLFYRGTYMDKMTYLSYLS